MGVDSFRAMVWIDSWMVGDEMMDGTGRDGENVAKSVRVGLAEQLPHRTGKG